MNPIITSIANESDIVAYQSFLEARLDEFDSARIGFTMTKLLCFRVKNDKEELGGIVASMHNKLLKVESFWLDESIRGRGFGSALLIKVEGAAKKAQCIKSSLETYSFQSFRFYSNHGYKIIGEINMKLYI